MMNFKPTQKNWLMLLAVEVLVKVEMCKVKRMSSWSSLSKVIPRARSKGDNYGRGSCFLEENLAFLQEK